jgi:glycosyltransferase involved in cell wall biosynthesis
MQKKRLKISVCIVTYNHAAYIHDCLSSVVAQYVDADLEILVGDDCSSDDTRLIISKFSKMYPDIIFPVFHEKNIGGSHNYQYLINLAQGDYIAHLDGDDFWMPGKLAAQISFLEEAPECSAAYANAIVINKTDELVACFNGKIPSKFNLSYLLKKGNFLNASSLVYRAECKEKLLQLQGEALDYHYNILMASQGQVGYINRFLVCYRMNSTTSISSARRDLLMELYWKAILNAWILGADHQALRQCIVGFYRSLVRSALTRGRFSEALQVAAKMREECPLVSKTLIVRSVLTLPYHIGKLIFRKLVRYVFKGGTEILFDR